ncbi:acetyl-CoA carboxylase, carboxyltransferase subunit beta [Candidatus Cardinium sp. TP]|uniref:acetyl-CoA carboxylase, carboxyltransferase subunit beta n=1 Tax=Candidatus Cardinium sp. TP TaxID=2961955 RepID=UPI0021AE3DF5|nr:acetyl-CoA carboxylase, carboxyltransferase subunit beta [Candidatus Cardinium sp. TP]MCT4697257.1 acetyl-CoA carboxylase, carboxyltransferase subunit beta [Candidatus Cardinium sp. TP]MDN5247224.1 acetyl-CoA carboxylase, carboxyltransferase subunit beta [Candidatus Cardinium sp.]
MSWFRRKKKGILTPSSAKKESPDGLWVKTPKGKIIHSRVLQENLHVVPDDGHHLPIGSKEYFAILFDENRFTELNATFRSADPLQFVDNRPYTERLKQAEAQTDLTDAIRTAYGQIHNLPLAIACMDFTFIGGSMGSVVGEKIAQLINHCLAHQTPLLIISKSGGARMMEGSFSLMQMAKTAAKLLQLAQAKIPYISLLTDPTTGGVSASYAMLGDINMAEPGALIGFAGPRVIRETVGKELPKGFQTAEFLLAHGFLDMIVDRRKLKETLFLLLKMLV